MKDIAYKTDKKDTENKKFIAVMTTLGLVAVSTVTTVLASALSENTKIESIDNNSL